VQALDWNCVDAADRECAEQFLALVSEVGDANPVLVVRVLEDCEGWAGTLSSA
jgi:hypothetical protein